VTVENRDELFVGRPVGLFRVGGDNGLLAGDDSFDVDAKGERIVLVRTSSAGDAARRRMILIQNWRRLLGSGPGR